MIACSIEELTYLVKQWSNACNSLFFIISISSVHICSSESACISQMLKVLLKNESQKLFSLLRYNTTPCTFLHYPLCNVSTKVLC